MRCPLAAVVTVLMAVPLGAEPEARSDLGEVLERAAKAMELLVAAFSPASPPTGEETAGTGRVAWKPETLEPVWLEYRPAKLPKRMRELSLRVEFAQVEDVLYPRRTSLGGVAGFLFIKRVFESTSAVSNLRLDHLQAPLHPE